MVTSLKEKNVVIIFVTTIIHIICIFFNLLILSLSYMADITLANSKTVKPVLKESSRDQKMQSLKTGGLLTQVNYN